MIGPEITSIPTRSVFHANIAAPAVAMAKDADGVVIAWTEPNADGYDTIHIARLDRSGHVDGAIQELPRFFSFDGASAPSIAASPSGRGFTIAWIEHGGAAYAVLDAKLNPSTPSFLISSFPSSVPTPVIVRSGKRTWITAAGTAWQLNDDGTIHAQYFAGSAASDMTARGDFPQLVSANRVQTTYTCNCYVPPGPLVTCPNSCRIYQYEYALGYVNLFSNAQSISLPFDSFLQPSVLNNGREVTVVWFRGSESSGGDVVATHVDVNSFANFSAASQSIGSFARDSGVARPDIASDGDHTLVVWANGAGLSTHDIVGSLVDRDGKTTPLTIAASADDERDPSVIAVGPGTFLVAYEKIGVTERRIAGRFVTIAPGRRHAAD